MIVSIKPTYAAKNNDCAVNTIASMPQPHNYLSMNGGCLFAKQ